MQKLFAFFFLVILFTASGFSQNTVRIFVWEDMNGNGIRSGEPVLADPGLLLYTANGAGNPVANTLIVPTFSGTYVQFAGVADGDYVVLFPNTNLYPGYYFTDFNADGANMQGTDTDTDSDANPALNFGNYRYCYRFSVAGSQIYDELGVGYVQPASIGDWVW